VQAQARAGKAQAVARQIVGDRPDGAGAARGIPHV